MTHSLKKVRYAALLVVIAVVATAADVGYFFPRRPNVGAGDIVTVEIPKGAGPNRTAEILSDAGLTTSPGRLRLWLRFSGRHASVKAGTFDIPDNLSPEEMVAILSGRPTDKGIKVVVPEGFTITRIAETLTAAGIDGAEGFAAYATDEKNVRALGLPGSTLEGFLFPDTYYFSKDATSEAVARIMTDNFRRKIKALGIPEDDALFRTVTLASIVQAEARLEKEMPLIAAVYRNRLTLPAHPSRLLQADPTVAYGCEPHIRPRPASCATFKGVLGRKQLDDPSNPYNTYRHPGLPPGPICAPGAQALAAALHPAKVPYLYFVTTPNGDGAHVFSTTYADHQKAVDALRAANAAKASP